MAFGKEIKRLREGANISVAKLAKLMHVDAERMRKWEQRDMSPKDDDTEAIELFFGLPIQEIEKLEDLKKFLKVPRETGNNLESTNEQDLKNQIIELQADIIRMHKERELELKKPGAKPGPESTNPKEDVNLSQVLQVVKVNQQMLMSLFHNLVADSKKDKTLVEAIRKAQDMGNH